MAVKVNLTLEQVKDALEGKISSIKRAANTNRNPKFKPIIEQELAEFTAAAATLTEQK